MKRVVEKKGKRIVVRHRLDDAASHVHGLAAKLATNEGSTLTARERDLLLIAIAQRLDIEV